MFKKFIFTILLVFMLVFSVEILYADEINNESEDKAIIVDDKPTSEALNALNEVDKSDTDIAASNEGPKNDKPAGPGANNGGPKNDGPAGPAANNEGPKNDGPAGPAANNEGPKNDGPAGPGANNEGPKNDELSNENDNNNQNETGSNNGIENPELNNENNITDNNLNQNNENQKETINNDNDSNENNNSNLENTTNQVNESSKGLRAVSNNYVAESKKAVKVSDILASLNIESNVVNVSTESEYITISGSGNDIEITPTNMFSSPEMITVVTEDGTYDINITSVPQHDKTITPNPAYDENGNVILDENGNVKGDGTYNLSLTVTGEADIKKESTGRVNVIVILDTSSSMIKRWAMDPKGSIGHTNFDSNHNQQDDHANTYDDGGYYYLYKKVGNEYVMLAEDEAYTGTVYRKLREGSNTEDSNFEEYASTKTRFIATRADKAEKTLYDFVTDLFDGYQSQTDPTNIQFALVGFSYNYPAQPNNANNKTQIIQNWTSNKEDILGTEENPKLSPTGKIETHRIGIYQQGTNYEAGFEKGQDLMETADDDPTYVIFITDGQPSQSNDGPATIGAGTDAQRVGYYRAALDEAWAISQNATLYGIYAFGDEDDYLDDLIYYVYNNQTDRTLSNTAAWNKATHMDETIENYYYKAEDADALEDAITVIFDEIASTMGVSQTQINDGTTSSVTAQSGTLPAEGLLDVDDESFEYWLSWKINDDNTFKMFNVDNEYTYTVTDNGDGTLTFAREGVSPVTYDGDIVNGIVKIKWGDYNNRPSTAFYSSAPQAVFENNTVTWDLSSLRTLLDGVTYEVTFDVWPSQTTLDLQADLRNNLIKYEDLKDDVKQYLDENGNLRTNTFATLTYDDTRTDDDETQNPINYPNPNPVETTTTEELAIAKEWVGYGDKPELTLYVERDGVNHYTVVLNDENNWHEKVYISVGILTIDKEGNVEAKTTGHDYAFAEDDTVSYQWELKAPVVHPMMINNVLTMLVLENEDHQKPETMTGDYYVETLNGQTYKWYKIGDKYYYEDESLASLTAINYRKSHLDVRKEITGENAPTDELFEYTISIDNNNEEEDEIWFSIYDTVGGVYIIGDEYVSQGTLEQKSKSDEEIEDVSYANGVLTYVTKNLISGALSTSKVLVGELENFDENAPFYTGYYYIAGSAVEGLIVKLNQDWSLRFLNTPTGTTYTITESNQGSFKLTNLSSTYNGTKQVEDETHSTNVNTQTITGVIDEPNTEYVAKFTNKYEETEATVVKVWNDADNQDGIRPVSLTVTLSNGETVTLNASNSWTQTVSNLPKYNNGQEITYTWTEGTLPDGYTLTNTSVNGTITTLTNSHTPEETEATVIKVWDDNNDAAEKRPLSLTVTLSNGETVTLNASNSWTQTVSNLPKYNNGQEISYTWTEGTLPDGYYLSNTSVNGTITTLTNTFEVVSATVVKVWDDADNQDGIRPLSLTVTLSNGETVTLNASNSWTQTISNLPKYNNGQEITYTWTEGTLPDGYTLTNTSVNGTITTLTNSHTPEETEATVIKVWDDANNQDGIRPLSLTVTLSNGETVTLNASNSWTQTISNLPKYNNGQEITYTWTEGTLPDGYTLTDTSVNGTITTLTNSHTPDTVDVTVKKVWDDADNQDGIRPESLTVTLSNGESVTLNEENEWTATIKDLPKNKDGKEIEYTWTEEGLPEGYELTDSSADGYVTTLTNSHTPDTVDVTVKKVWDDADNQDGIRPESLTVTLSNGESVTLNEENEWTATIKDLPKNKDGKEIEYTWTEEGLPEGYELTDSSTDGYVTTLTNSHTPETIEVKVRKVWDDKNNYNKLRPEEVTIILYADGQKVDSVKLNKSNNWAYTFTELDKYNNGKEIEYTIEEESVKEYTTEITGDMYEGFVVTNTHSGEGGDNPNPQTGDSIYTYIAMLIVCIGGFLGFTRLYLKNN